MRVFKLEYKIRGVQEVEFIKATSCIAACCKLIKIVRVKYRGLATFKLLKINFAFEE